MIARPTSLVRSVVTAVLPLAMIACAAPTTPNAAEQTPSTTSAPAASQAAPSETVLYLQQDYSPQLQPINPVTLADATNRTSFVLDGAFPYTQPQFFMSRDGGTVVALDGDRVRVLDGASGTQRTEWPRPQNEYVRGISPDGTRLVASQVHERERGQGWAVLSSDDGQVLVSGRSQYPIFDWQNNRVYGFGGSGDPLEQIEPQPAVLLVHDLQSSDEIGRLTLDGVLHGSEFGPSMALHPNEQQLVLLHGDADKLTIVDTQQMQIVSTRDLTGSQDPLKADNIRGWDLQFAPNGTLYAGGSEQPVVRNLGIRRINVEQAEIEAEALIDENWSWYRVAPDGSAIFFYGSRPGPVPSAVQGGPPPNPALLRRLDPQTLTVTAERPFEGFYQPFLVAQPKQ